VSDRLPFAVLHHLPWHDDSRPPDVVRAASLFCASGSVPFRSRRFVDRKSGRDIQCLLHHQTSRQRHGLAISRSIVESHSGCLWATTDEARRFISLCQSQSWKCLRQHDSEFLRACDIASGLFLLVVVSIVAFLCQTLSRRSSLRRDHVQRPNLDAASALALRVLHGKADCLGEPVDSCSRIA
jgi:hypothetical protein